MLFLYYYEYILYLNASFFPVPNVPEDSWVWFSMCQILFLCCLQKKSLLQCSKLTFSKRRLLATFNCKMVAINKNSVAKKTLEGEDTSWHITQGATAPNGAFSTLRFATVRERERRDCLVEKTICFNITKLLRPGNTVNGAQKPFKSIKFAILSRSSF